MERKRKNKKPFSLFIKNKNKYNKGKAPTAEHNNDDDPASLYGTS